jgi:hypothetical protein
MFALSGEGIALLAFQGAAFGAGSATTDLAESAARPAQAGRGVAGETLPHLTVVDTPALEAHLAAGAAGQAVSLPVTRLAGCRVTCGGTHPRGRIAVQAGVVIAGVDAGLAAARLAGEAGGYTVAIHTEITRCAVRDTLTVGATLTRAATAGALSLQADLAIHA